MATDKWEIKGPSFGGCNCEWNCPCQYNLPPSHGHCQGIDAMLIEEGHFGETRLDGLLYVGLYKWPGPIEEGNGHYQAIIDERADEAQRQAIQTIVYGQHTDEVVTYFDVFASTMSKQFDPLFRPIDFECNQEARAGKVVVKGIVEASGTPIIDKHTGEAQRVRLDMPEGFEFTLAEIGNLNTTTTGDVEIQCADTYAQWAQYHFNQDGIVRD